MLLRNAHDTPIATTATSMTHYMERPEALLGADNSLLTTVTLRVDGPVMGWVDGAHTSRKAFVPARQEWLLKNALSVPPQ